MSIKSPLLLCLCLLVSSTQSCSRLPILPLGAHIEAPRIEGDIPIAGYYGREVDFKLVSDRADARIMYSTVPGAKIGDATASWREYSAPIHLSAPTEMSAYAYVDGSNVSELALGSYRMKVPKPTIAIKTGNPRVPVFIDIDCELKSSVTIRYDLGGADISADPSAGTLYEVPIPYEKDAAGIRAIARRPLWTDSDLTEPKSLVIDRSGGTLAFLGINNPGGAYSAPILVTCDTTGLPSDAVVRYTQSVGTVSGDPPAPTYFVGLDFPAAGLTVDRSMTLKIAAMRSGYTITELSSSQFYDMAVANPAYSLADPTYDSPRKLNLSSTSPGASIRYTTDGTSLPTSASGTTYDPALGISVDRGVTVKAMAYRAGWRDSAIASRAYSIAVGAPAFSLDPVPSYDAIQTLTLSSASPGASIRYELRTDGSTPPDPTPASGTVHSGPITVSANSSFKAVAYFNDATSSSVVGRSYGFRPAAPSFSPLGGAYVSGQTVYLQTTGGASIRYTTDGTTIPTSAVGTLYSAATGVTVDRSMTLRAIAYRTGWTDSAATSQIYSITVVAPVFSLDPVPSYDAGQTLSLSSASPGTSIRYELRTDGSTPPDPTPTSGTVHSGPIPVSVNSSFKALAYLNASASSTVASAVYGFRPAAPSFSPAGGSYASGQTVYLSTTGGASIRYTTDGVTTPTSLVGTLYSAAAGVAVDRSMTLRTIAYKTGWSDSAVASQIYSITVAAPVFSLNTAAVYDAAQTLSLSSATPGATLRYELRTDGSTPPDPTPASGAVYSGPISVSVNSSFKALAYLNASASSAVASAVYDFRPAAPSFSPAGGSYSSGQTVYLSTTGGASIRYTTDGATIPTSTVGTLYAAASGVAVDRSMTLRAIAYKTGWTDSAVASQIYSITVAAPVFSLNPVTVYDAAQTLSLSSASPGAAIRYELRTDGSTPPDPTPASGAVYSGPISVSVNSSFKALAYLNASASSTVATAVYAFKVAKPVIMPDDGLPHAAPYTVYLYVATPGASIRITRNASAPTVASEAVGAGGGVTLVAGESLRARAFLANWNDSDIAVAAFTVP